MGLFLDMEDGRTLSFTEFCHLQESVEPKVTDYGIDVENGFKNKKWELTETGIHVHTYFLQTLTHQVRVILNIQTRDIAFSTRNSDMITSNPRGYSHGRMDMGDALKVLNKVVYVVLECIKSYHLDEVKFSGIDPQLGTLYDRICANKFFIQKMKDHGFGYQGKDENESHVFKKV